ncbi:hypothetical protein ACFRQM_40150 [Streptomyces sp. NPDC056831]
MVGTAAGPDSIDDLGILRHGAMPDDSDGHRSVLRIDVHVLGAL